MTKQTLTRIVCFCSLLAIATASQAQPGSLKKYFAKPAPVIEQRSPDLPPVQFDHPFIGKLTLTRVKTLAEVRDACPNAVSNINGVTLGCTYATADQSRCRIILIEDSTLLNFGKDPDDVYRHEIGHCNGWKHAKPGAR